MIHFACYAHFDRVVQSIAGDLGLTGLKIILSLVCLGLLKNSVSAESQPNILVMVADNLGWNDVGYNGSEICTPNIDRLAAEGVRLDHHYVFPMCSPTRAGFITGRAPTRFGIFGAIGATSPVALSIDVTTIADGLQSCGWETAITGKWHLTLKPEVGPRQFGFDHTYGYLHGQLDKITHRYKNGDRSWHRNDQLIDEQGHSLDLITAEAIRQIEASRSKPFFLYVPFDAPHPPLQDEPKWVEPYQSTIADPSRRLYAAAVSHMDDSVGKIIDALDRSGQRKRTLVLFFSDNGAIPSLEKRPQDYEGRFGPYPVLGDNGPLRDWIGTVYDGCLRAPAVVNWPGQLKPAVADQVVSVLDWFPTLLRQAGGTVDASWGLEGRDIWPLLHDGQSPTPSVLYWSTGGASAVREGKWKLVSLAGGKRFELYDLDQDPYEKRDASAQQPQLMARLKILLVDNQSRDLVIK